MIEDMEDENTPVKSEMTPDTQERDHTVNTITEAVEATETDKHARIEAGHHYIGDEMSLSRETGHLHNREYLRAIIYVS